MSPARQVAFDVLRKVENGGYASDLLLKLSAEMDSRDAGLASEIVFGCLRYQAQLDYLIDRLTSQKGKSFSASRAVAGQPPAEPPSAAMSQTSVALAPPAVAPAAALQIPRKLDPEVRIALRMGIYQLRYLDRIPAHAAVGESVELVKRAHKQSAAGLVNAVLRKVDRAPVAWPDRATELSLPLWLAEKWDRQFGPDITEQLAAAFLQPAETYVASTGRTQDIGAQSVVPMLDLHPGLTLLDLCAAPGNKTAQALQYGVEAIACDIHWRRLKNVEGLKCHRVVVDATHPLPFDRRFDRILVDAPCSGTGTLGRNPEIKWRLQSSDLIDLHRKQVALVRNALRHLKPDGRLVYSTCSLEPEENQAVVDAIPGAWEIVQRLPGRDEGDGFFIAVLALSS